MKKSKLTLVAAVVATILSGASVANSDNFEYKDLQALDTAKTPAVEILDKTEESVWSRHRRRF
ncbi:MULTISPECIES: hypothetical protein [Vibrio]|uniref:Uncharacterized protein n=2 Tax=Vibrio TaxID=662 RepID=A0A510IER8_9VIBR|nr:MULTISPECIES: hypothetical protein [Vibrio]RTZ24590.1 hypothetical protein EKN09_02730 [Vibrio penaeicida]BBL92294.1 hypothetical protein VroAM7_49470 [Vibrio rotiferianus]GLQ71091.1 hypothetical protein GCM10007932_04510 [Vibrio penaeicida]